MNVGSSFDFGIREKSEEHCGEGKTDILMVILSVLGKRISFQSGLKSLLVPCIDD
jgi:hypothetical protein